MTKRKRDKDKLYEQSIKILKLLNEKELTKFIAVHNYKSGKTISFLSDDVKFYILKYISSIADLRTLPILDKSWNKIFTNPEKSNCIKWKALLNKTLKSKWTLKDVEHLKNSYTNTAKPLTYGRIYEFLVWYFEPNYANIRNIINLWLTKEKHGNIESINMQFIAFKLWEFHKYKTLYYGRASENPCGIPIIKCGNGFPQNMNISDNVCQTLEEWSFVYAKLAEKLNLNINKSAKTEINKLIGTKSRHSYTRPHAEQCLYKCGKSHTDILRYKKRGHFRKGN